MDDTILVERPDTLGGRISVIRINRPDKKNALTRAMYRAMADALDAVSADGTVRVAVILGGAGAFSAGNDMGDFLAYAEGGALGTEIIDFLKTLATFDKPLISGVDGLAIGIGTTMHLHCDLTFATQRSEFRTPFADLGLVPEAASSLLAPRVMGHQRAFALLAAGASFSAAAALEAGLICKLVEDEEMLEETVFEAARALADKPPQALKIARDLLRGSHRDILARIDEEARHFSERLRSEEARAAFNAFLARKKT